jgi:hypothetical protein
MNLYDHLSLLLKLEYFYGSSNLNYPQPVRLADG